MKKSESICRSYKICIPTLWRAPRRGPGLVRGESGAVRFSVVACGGFRKVEVVVFLCLTYKDVAVPVPFWL